MKYLSTTNCVKTKLLIAFCPLMFLIGCTNPFTNTYTITFKCPNCLIVDDTGKEITKAKIEVSKNSRQLNQKFYFKDTDTHKKPLEASAISVKKSSNHKLVDFRYIPSTGEIMIPLVSSLTISSSGVQKTLNECTWDCINNLSMSGKAKDFFHIGDEKNVTLLENGEPQEFAHKVRIIGFDHDYTDPNRPDDSKVGITFEFVNVFTNSQCELVEHIWDGVETPPLSGNNCFYPGSVLQTSLNETRQGENLYDMIPLDLQNVAKKVYKNVGIKTEEMTDYVASPFATTFFPLSYEEMLGLPIHSFVTPNEGRQYEYYETRSNIVKFLATDNDSNVDLGKSYWIRSPYIDNKNKAWCIGYDGGHYDYDVCKKEELGIAPAFCV